MLLLNVLLLVANGFASRLMTALALFCTKLPFRRGGKVIFPVFIAAMVAFPALFQIRMGVDFYGWEGLKAGGLSLAFILTLFVAMAGIAVCFKVTFGKLLFIGAGGYVIQNLMYDFVWMLKLLFPAFGGDSYLTYDSLSIFSTDFRAAVFDLVGMLIIYAGYVLLYFLFVRKWGNGHYIKVSVGILLFYLVVVLLVLNILSYYAMGAEQSILITLLLLVCSCFLLVIQFFVFNRVRLEQLEFAEHLAAKAMDRQRLSQEAIERINIKSHDLRRSVAALRREMDGGQAEKQLLDTEQAVRDYDAVACTGSDPLDLILTEKKRICDADHIEFTYMADGGALAAIGFVDLYVMLSNALDNAIECVLGEEEPNRIVTMKVFRKTGAAIVNIENYCSHRLRFEGGLPQTIKEDKENHGFGMHSIRSVAQKYGGSIAAGQEGDRFILNIMFPLAAAE